MGKELGKAIYLYAKQRVSWVPCEMAFLANLTIWHDSSASSHVLHMWPFASYSSRKLVANCTNPSLKLNSSPFSHTHPLQINPHKYKEMIEEITIKFSMKLKPTKASWKSQLCIFNFQMNLL